MTSRARGGDRAGARRGDREAAEPDDWRIGAIARRQHGVVTRQQLLGAGLGKGGISYRVEVGRLYPLHRGVYAVGHRPVSPYARALAAVLACGAGAVLSHGSAATLWGIAKDWRGPFEVTARSKHRHRGLVIHRSGTLVRRDRTFHFGIPVTTPSRTLLDIAARMDDVSLARAVNNLRLARYLSLTEFAEFMARHPGRGGAKRLRSFLAHPTRAPTRSEFEDAFILFAERHGLPEPEVNTRVAGHEVDVLFAAHRLAVELDGYDTHRGRTQFESDRDRDADLLAAQIATVRITWERMALRPAREASRLHAILGLRS